ncbi:TetR/AcrR family transcriptional regulator [Halomonas sp. C05BenzN]|uniref:TetR/AcrR family transcriptional regulator n=1 Tax=Halomonas sp. C05BenzN TaxID=3411041 RepID=UPI003B9593B4
MGAETGRRRRLSPEQRERQIVDEAIRFFAEVGFEGQTRELAKRLGITQPLLYRYFPSKESLIERVYHEVYVKRWQPHWEALIIDRSRPLQERLITLYQEYTRVIFNYEWVRILMFSGLKGVNITERYLSIVQDKLFVPVCTELREVAGLPSTDEVPLQPEELELAWDLHGGIYYLAIRKWIYNLPIPEDLDRHIEMVVHNFMEGTPETLRWHFARGDAQPSLPRG